MERALVIVGVTLSVVVFVMAELEKVPSSSPEVEITL